MQNLHRSLRPMALLALLAFPAQSHAAQAQAGTGNKGVITLRDNGADPGGKHTFTVRAGQPNDPSTLYLLMDGKKYGPFKSGSVVEVGAHGLWAVATAKRRPTTP